MCVCVCVCVCVCLQALGTLGKAQIVKSVTLIRHTSSLGESLWVFFFFHFLEMFVFGPFGTRSSTLNGPKTFGSLYGSHKWLNLSEIRLNNSLFESLWVFFFFFFFHFLKNFDPGDSVLDPKSTENLQGALGKP